MMNSTDTTSPQPVITSCDVGKMPKSWFDAMPEITVVLSNGASASLGTYYPDEIKFVADTFIGKTLDAAKEIIRKRDVAYLQS